MIRKWITQANPNSNVDDGTAILAVFKLMGTAVGGIMFLIFSLTAGCGWINAGAQRDVYARQGIEMTRWEVFCGAKPPEQNVNLRMKDK